MGAVDAQAAEPDLRKGIPAATVACRPLSTLWLTAAGSDRTFNLMVKSESAGLDAVFHALSDPTRRAILRDISVEQKTVGAIARPYQMSLAAVSKHLKVLEAAKLVSRERQGSFQVIRLNAAAMRTAIAWMRFYERFWNDKLDSLQALLEGESDE